MRKIEEEMLDAIRYGENFGGGNTMVITDANGVSHVYLHGVHIADATRNTVTITDMERHPKRFSPTTSSRVNALLSDYNVHLTFSNKYGTIKYDNGEEFVPFTTFSK